MVDHDHIDRPFWCFELHADLFGESGEQERARGVFGVRRPFERPVVFAGEPGIVEHRSYAYVIELCADENCAACMKVTVDGFVLMEIQMTATQDRCSVRIRSKKSA